MRKSINYNYWIVEYKNKEFKYCATSNNIEDEQEAINYYNQRCLEYDEVWLVRGNTTETVQLSKEPTP